MVLPWLGGVQQPYSYLISLFFLAFIFVWIFLGQRLQTLRWQGEIARGLQKLDYLRDEARGTAIKTLKERGKAPADPTVQVDQFLESFFIEPESMDPSGIVPKFDRLLDVRDLSSKDHVRRMVSPDMDESTVNTLENLLEVAMGIHQLYKLVRHYYLFGKRTKAYIITMQLYMLMPQIMDIASAYHGALNAFAQGQPIGDGAGSLLANKLMRAHGSEKIAKDMVFSQVTLEDRQVYVLKAEGPGGNVGKPSEAIRKLAEDKAAKAIIMVDAGLKLEGEDTGKVSEGIGAAIGGIGTERFMIEDVAHKLRLPLYAVVIKESLKEAIAPMKKEIYEGVENAINTVRQIIRENTKEGDTVILAGIGNTLGIAQ